MFEDPHNLRDPWVFGNDPMSRHNLVAVCTAGIKIETSITNRGV